MPAANAVVIEGVWKYFGDYPALRDISFNLDGGACLALLGRNGAGKTTLLRILGGLSKAARGRVSILGKDTRAGSTRQRIGILGHGIGVYEELSAFENLSMFGRSRRCPTAHGRARAW
jgi:ABC-type multidrug transport system ATPase subunit